MEKAASLVARLPCKPRGMSAELVLWGSPQVLLFLASICPKPTYHLAKPSAPAVSILLEPLQEGSCQPPAQPMFSLSAAAARSENTVSGARPSSADMRSPVPS